MMSRQAFLELFPPMEPDNVDRNIRSLATRKGHKHIHKSSFKPTSGKLTPAEYRRNHKGKKG